VAPEPPSPVIGRPPPVGDGAADNHNGQREERWRGPLRGGQQAASIKRCGEGDQHTSDTPEDRSEQVTS
jgi:hypothetical protein